MATTESTERRLTQMLWLPSCRPNAASTAGGKKPKIQLVKQALAGKHSEFRRNLETGLWPGKLRW